MYLLPFQQDLSTVGVQRAPQNLAQCALAGPVLPDQGENLTPAQRKAHIGYGQYAGKRLSKFLYDQ
jgi:hypothetical protein